jgi:uncharacterized protein YjbI with pentapeptide repeats
MRGSTRPTSAMHGWVAHSSSGADLRETKFCDGDLSGAHLEGANFFKAVFDGAKLAGAFLTEAS